MVTSGSHTQSGRHRARRNAMMVLYNCDLLQRTLDSAIAVFEQEHGFALPEYARTVVEGVADEQDDVDAALIRHLDDWSLDRLGVVERSILRIACWELLTETVPTEVAIDEAVELSRRYASPEAAKLVNGVLAAIDREQRSSQ